MPYQLHPEPDYPIGTTPKPYKPEVYKPKQPYVPPEHKPETYRQKPVHEPYVPPEHKPENYRQKPEQPYVPPEHKPETYRPKPVPAYHSTTSKPYQQIAVYSTSPKSYGYSHSSTPKPEFVRPPNHVYEPPESYTPPTAPKPETYSPTPRQAFRQQIQNRVIAFNTKSV